MNRTDQHMIFRALGFLTLILRYPQKDEETARVRAIATLIEAFCAEAVPDSLAIEHLQDMQKGDTVSTGIVSSMNHFLSSLRESSQKDETSFLSSLQDLQVLLEEEERFSSEQAAYSREARLPTSAPN
jgi:hypothetical protein